MKGSGVVVFNFSKVKKCRCEICNRQFLVRESIAIATLGPSVIQLLKETCREYNPKGYLCRKDLRNLRSQQIRSLFEQTGIEAGHLESILLAEDATSPYSFNQEYQKELTWGERLSQRVTPMIGSWGFVAIFFIFVTTWITYNLQDEIREHFDPFPFILLNLSLSCMAAIQAPVIMMAQHRLAKRESLRADEDYYTNMKAELEIRQIQLKLDDFIKRWESKQ